MLGKNGLGCRHFFVVVVVSFVLLSRSHGLSFISVVYTFLNKQHVFSHVWHVYSDHDVCMALNLEY
jgi:hypothetical protein